MSGLATGWEEIDWGAGTALQKVFPNGDRATISQTPDINAEDDIITDVAITVRETGATIYTAKFEGENGLDTAMYQVEVMRKAVLHPYRGRKEGLDWFEIPPHNDQEVESVQAMGPGKAFYTVREACYKDSDGKHRSYTWARRFEHGNPIATDIMQVHSAALGRDYCVKWLMYDEFHEDAVEAGF